MPQQVQLHHCRRGNPGVVAAYHFGVTPKGVNPQEMLRLSRGRVSAVSLTLALQQYGQYAAATAILLSKGVQP